GARQPGGEPAHGPGAAARELPAGVRARLAPQDLLPRAATGPAAAGERRGGPRRAVWRRPAARRASAADCWPAGGCVVLAWGESGALRGERGAARLERAVPDIQVPARVQAVLAARIDRLAPEDKRLLQSAAVIGHELPFSLLLAVAEGGEDRLRASLARLQEA